MKITVCGSIKFIDRMKEIQKQLEELGHQVFMPIKAKEVDYWSEDNKSRVEAKKKYGFIKEHMERILDSDAILVVNITKNEVENYIGANTFLEIGFAYCKGKKIFLLNPVPKQSYIIDELETVEPQVINGDLTKIN